MLKKSLIFLMIVFIVTGFTFDKKDKNHEFYTEDTLISDVISDPVFEDYGRLIFPVNTQYMQGDTLGNLDLTWYNNIQPKKTVICNYFKEHVQNGDVIFYDIYSDEEKRKILPKRIPAYFSLKGNRAQNLRSVQPEEVLSMSVRCRTAFLMRLPYPKWDITHLP